MKILINTEDGVIKGKAEVESLMDILKLINYSQWLLIETRKGEQIAVSTDKIISIREDER